MYIDKNKLASLVEVAQTEGRLTHELYSYLSNLMHAVWAMSKRTNPNIGKRASWEDFQQTAVLRTCELLPRLEADGNTFSYLQQVYGNILNRMARDTMRYQGTLARYRMILEGAQSVHFTCKTTAVGTRGSGKRASV